MKRLLLAIILIASMFCGANFSFEWITCDDGKEYSFDFEMHTEKDTSWIKMYPDKMPLTEYTTYYINVFSRDSLDTLRWEISKKITKDFVEDFDYNFECDTLWQDDIIPMFNTEVKMTALLVIIIVVIVLCTIAFIAYEKYGVKELSKLLVALIEDIADLKQKSGYNNIRLQKIERTLKEERK